MFVLLFRDHNNKGPLSNNFSDSNFLEIPASEHHKIICKPLLEGERSLIAYVNPTPPA